MRTHSGGRGCALDGERVRSSGREAYQTGRGCALALPEAVDGVAVVCCCSSVAAVDAWTVARRSERIKTRVRESDESEERKEGKGIKKGSGNYCQNLI